LEFGPTTGRFFFGSRITSEVSGAKIGCFSTGAKKRLHGAMGKGKGYTPAEDEYLARSWRRISEDEDKGAGQKAEEFWQRIASDYNKLVVTQEQFLFEYI
jgi:hypothetical protein